MIILLDAIITLWIAYHLMEFAFGVIQLIAGIVLIFAGVLLEVGSAIAQGAWFLIRKLIQVTIYR